MVDHDGWHRRWTTDEDQPDFECYYWVAITYGNGTELAFYDGGAWFLGPEDITDYVYAWKEWRGRYPAPCSREEIEKEQRNG